MAGCALRATTSGAKVMAPTGHNFTFAARRLSGTFDRFITPSKDILKTYGNELKNGTSLLILRRTDDRRECTRPISAITQRASAIYFSGAERMQVSLDWHNKVRYRHRD